MRGSWVLIVLAASLGLLAGVAGQRLWQGSGGQSLPARNAPPPLSTPGTMGASEPVPDRQGPGGRITSLRERIRREEEARKGLAREVADLRAELLRSEPETAPGDEDESPSEPRGDEPRASFDDQALADMGIDPREISWLHQRSDEFEMQRLDLLDRATREGWVRTPRYREELRTQNLRLREDLGDELYDRMLYALGRKNRVTVADVLSHSPAEAAEIDERDSILYYDGQRIFNAFELREATTRGRRGESVTVELLRGGRLIQVVVPRGPLGVRIRGERHPPLPGP